MDPTPRRQHHRLPGCDPVGGTNEAQWRLSAKGRFEVRPTAPPTAGPGEVVVRVRAVAMHPVDAIGAAAEPRDDVVLVWGASTSVGCNAVQLARASGYIVLTAGTNNHELVRSLGAEAVFDCRDAHVGGRAVSSRSGPDGHRSRTAGCARRARHTPAGVSAAKIVVPVD